MYKCAREVMLSSPLPCQVRAKHAECPPGSLSYWNQVLPTMVRSGCRPTSDQELSEKARPAASSGTVRYIGSSGSQATTTNTSTHTDGLGAVHARCCGRLSFRVQRDRWATHPTVIPAYTGVTTSFSFRGLRRLMDCRCAITRSAKSSRSARSSIWPAFLAFCCACRSL